MPQRLTVAGLAVLRSEISKSIFMSKRSFIRSPLDRQSIMESSSTVFMFSIQIGSTGPSKCAYFTTLSNGFEFTNPRKMHPISPSVHC